MFGMIMLLCNRMFCCNFGWYFYIEIRLKYEIKIILLSSSRAISLSTPVNNSVATWKRATKCNKYLIWFLENWNGWFSEWNYWFWVTVPEQMVEKPPQFWTLVVLKIERLLNICCLSYPFDLLHYNRYLEKMK